ncbi:MAG: VanZ family protein [Chloroflexi bacterium]|nr:VanZ family protein [Chloroflexota bacterium]
MDTLKPLFTSVRERRLWLWTLAVVAAIYSTLGLASRLAGALRNRGLIDEFFFFCFLLVLAAILTQGLKTRPRGIEIGVGLGVAAAYLFVFARMAIPAAERTHLIEYSVVALLIYEALTERASQGRRVIPKPALFAFALTVLLGWLDEGIQWLLPNRVYDIRDVGFNALAALMAIVGNLALSWVRRTVKKRLGE